MKIHQLWIAIFALLGATAAQAEIVDYTVTGTVGGEFDNLGLFGAPGSQQVVGDSFTASFVVNLAGVPPGADSVSTPFISDSLTINGNTLSGIGGVAGDSASLIAGQEFSISATAPNGTYLLFTFDPNPSGVFPIQSLSSPVSYAVSVADGDTGGGLGYYDSTGQVLEASMALAPTNLTITPVPLPAAAWLMLSGLGALGAFARKARAA